MSAAHGVSPAARETAREHEDPGLRAQADALEAEFGGRFRVSVRFGFFRVVPAEGGKAPFSALTAEGARRQVRARLVMADFPGWSVWISRDLRTWRAVRMGRSLTAWTAAGHPVTVEADDEQRLREQLSELPGPR